MSDGASLNVERLPAIPGYVLRERIGTGGSGVVYRAQADDALGRRFAIKVFPPTHQSDYRRELATLRSIEAVRSAAGSRDLVEIVAASEVDDYGYVVMEFASQGSLHDRVDRDGPVPPREAVAFIEPVLRALSLLHRNGILHKDVKPANVLIGDDGQPRLGDFGLARALSAGPVSAAGTPGFCAPELYAGGAVEASGERIDVYSAAATLYFLLTGQAPLPGRPDLFLLERRRVDRGLQSVLFQALAVDPAQRIGSADALARTLAAWSEGRLPRAIPHASRLLGAAAAAGVIGLGLIVALVLNTPVPDAPPLWDGAELNLAGPTVTWNADGSASLVAAEALLALAERPVAAGRDPAGRTLAAITRHGETAALRLDGAATLLTHLEAVARDDEVEPLCAVATDGVHLARMVVREHGEDAVEVFALDGRTIARRSGLPAASALALHTEPGLAGPTILVGTPSGRVLAARPGQEEVRSGHSHQDEILALAVDPDRGYLLVVGDDRALLVSHAASANQVALESPGRVISLAPRIRLKVYALRAFLVNGELRLVADLDASSAIGRNAID